MAAIMGSLGGEGQLSIDQGRYTGIDLDKILRSGDLKTGTTLFDRVSAIYSMVKGVLKMMFFFSLCPTTKCGAQGL